LTIILGEGTKLDENGNKVILVVDDEEKILMMLSAVLERAGYHVEVAQDAFHALSLLGKQDVDLVISDVNMPNFSGVKLAKRLQPRRIKMLMLTGDSSPEVVQESIDSGVAGFITKSSFKPKNFLARVKSVLEQ